MRIRIDAYNLENFTGARLLIVVAEREMDRDHREQRDHENLNENEGERKLGMDFRNLSHHHSVDHAADVEAEVGVIYFQEIICKILILLKR